eukprot:c15565_g1_i1.p1 GENE.c15565_g1_i1~~c15565_g1_i1.p1  ORF type:complete len:367 (+),score=85.09 c15565_g1_i1:608-1708(+)
MSTKLFPHFTLVCVGVWNLVVMVSLALLEQLTLPAFLIICAMQVGPVFVGVYPTAQMLVVSSLTVFIGCVRSVKQTKTESMTSKDAYMFPIIGSSVLVSLYLVIKYVPKEYLNVVLGAYVFLIGTLAIHGALTPFAMKILPSLLTSHTPFELLFKRGEEKLIDTKLVYADFVCLAIGGAICTVYLLTKYWVMNNILGVVFAIQGIEVLSLGNIKIGIVLLLGLFVYDVFWVFGTDVMVSVAKGFDAPVKLLFAKNLASLAEGEEPKFWMIGLGDLVIPGIFVALVLRFDAFRNPEKITYFLFNFTGYVLGLIATIVVMLVFEAAQPALLYLVPACLITSLVPALMFKDIKALFEYSEEAKEERKDK